MVGDTRMATVRECVGRCGRTRLVARATVRSLGHWVCDECRPARQREMGRVKSATYRMRRRVGRERSLWDVHRLTPAQYDAMVEAQGGTCAGCGRGDQMLHIDHAHDCPAGHSERQTCPRCRRGLLCADCNHTLGMAGDSPETLRALAAYLERSR